VPGPPKAFVVDDYGPARESLSMLLTAFGWDARGFANGRDCFAAVLAAAPDCIVTDLMMPSMNGAELSEALAARRIPVPVIVMSALSFRSDLGKRAIQAGVFCVLSKPCQAEEIRNALDEALLSRASHR
jgi:FixJ family two-component response regulator